MTRVFKTIAEFNHFQDQSLRSKTIGFVPTMGALHAGHASLFRTSQKENNATIASIFVNPMQFNNPNDLEKYPRTFDADLELCEKNGVNYLIFPTPEDIYPKGYQYKIIENELAQLMEGQHRPGHFDGVLTIVMKLFNIVKPDRAYFGEKDFQQFQLIKNMVSDFFMDIDVIGCPTVREASGLAMSSRNKRLSEVDQEKASVIYKALTAAPSPDESKKMIEQQGLKVEYLMDHQGRRYVAAVLNDVRLIDNVELK